MLVTSGALLKSRRLCFSLLGVFISFYTSEAVSLGTWLGRRHRVAIVSGVVSLNLFTLVYPRTEM